MKSVYMYMRKGERQTKLLIGLQLGLLLTISTFFWGCPKDPDPPAVERTMRIELGPTQLLSNTDLVYEYRVLIEGEGAEADSILCEVVLPNGNSGSRFALMDDGNAGMLWGPDYAGSSSHDIVPSDRRFSRGINARLLANGVNGSYQFRFSPVGNFTLSAPLTLNVQLQDLSPCIIHSATHLPTLGPCDGALDLNALVRPDAGDEVDSVWFQVLSGGEVMAELSLHPISGDTMWNAPLLPSFIRCLPSGTNYFSRYVAKTGFGLTCRDDSSALAVNNPLPVLSNSTLPDTIYRPVAMGDTDTVIVTVNLQDCELLGATDYYGLQFESYRDDQPWGRASDFFLRDDGVPADVVAGDGIYTVGLRFWRNDNIANSVYYFRYYAIEGFLADCVPFDTSAYLLDSVRVIQPGVLLGGRDVGGGAEFGIVNGRR